MRYKIGNAFTIMGGVLGLAFLDNTIKFWLMTDIGLEEKYTIARFVPYMLLMLIGLRMMEKANEKSNKDGIK